MSAFLLKLLELSLQAGALTIAILLVRLVFRKLPARYLCVLWMIVAARLIIPFSFESSLAPMRSIEALLVEEEQGTIYGVLESMTETYVAEDGTVIVKQLYPAVDANDEVDYYISENGTLHIEDKEGDYYIDGTSKENDSSYYVEYIEIIKDMQVQATVPGTDSNTDSVYYIAGVTPTPVVERPAAAVFQLDLKELLTSLTPVLLSLWLLGMVLLLGYGVYSCIKVQRMVKNSMQYEDNIWLCEGLESPFLFGWIHPKIYLPTNLEETQLQYVIEHEKSHIARGDNYAKLIGYALLSVYWFNPFIWVAYVMFCKDVERACDERVIGGFTVEDRKSYADALLQCSMDHRFAISNPLAFGEMDVKKRIVGILNYKKPGKWVAVIAVLLCVLAAAGCFMVQKEEQQYTQYSPLEVSPTPVVTSAASPTPADPTATPAPTMQPAETPTPTPAEYVVVPANPREGSDEDLLGNATPETVLPVPLGQTVSVDLDGDGTEESVTFGVEGYEGKVKFNDIVDSLRGTNVDIDDLYYLQIDDTRLSQAQMEEAAWSSEGVGFTYYIFDVDVNDGYKEIGIFFNGPNTPTGVYLYRFVDGSLQCIGGFMNEVLPTDHHNYEAPELPYEDMVNYISREGYLISVPGDGTIYCKEITHLLQTVWFVSEFRLQNGEAGADARLEKVIRDYYEYSSWESGREEHYAKTTKIEFEAWATPSMDADKVFVPEGNHVAIYEYVPGEIWGDGWIRIFYTVNEMWDSEAWLPVSETDKIILPDKELDADDIFENLSHAG